MTRKLGLRFSEHLDNPHTAAGQLPPQAQMIVVRAEALRLGASWFGAVEHGPE